MAANGSNSGGMGDVLGNIGVGMSDVFVNLSAEYPALLTFIFVCFAAAGILISASAVFDLIKIEDRNQASQGSAKAIFAKMIGGSLLIDMAFWASVMGDSLWSYADPLGIESYSASSGSDDLGQTALMAVIGFIVLAGYVVLGRGYFMITKLGYLTPDARSDLIGSIISRIAAGTAMIACLHIAKAIDNSTGLMWLPS